MYEYCSHINDFSFGINNLDLLIKYYEKTEDEHMTKCGLLWSIDDNDAMEQTTRDLLRRKHKMKKLFALILIAVMTLTSLAAIAETYDKDDITFIYDETVFEITMDDHTDDEDLIILSGKEAAWGNTYIRIHLADLDDGKTFPTLDDFAVMPDAKDLTQGEWNGFSNVIMYTVEDAEGGTESFFIAPVTDDDGEVEDILTVEVGVAPLDDEALGMARSDKISEVLDTLKVDD